jgi:glycosyltransferase involved in cell wall biosynthesis
MFKISIVTNSLGGGGAEHSMNLLTNELADRGYSVTLVPINNGVKELAPIRGQIISLNRERESSVIQTLKILFEFKRKINSLHSDFVVLNCDLPELFGLFLSRRMNLIVVEHANPAWSTRQKLGRIVRILHFMKNSTFVAVSDHLRVWPTTRLPKAVTHNILPKVEGSIVETSSQEQVSRLVYIGRLAKVQKRPHWLIEISRRTKLPVLFVGAGEEEENLIQEAKSSGINAEFSGHQVDPWATISKGDLVVVPSLFEGDGLVAVEAIAKGIPLLLSDIRDFRRFELGEISYASSLDAFVNRILENKHSIYSLRVSKTDRERILKDRDPVLVGDTWAKIFEDLRGLN